MIGALTLRAVLCCDMVWCGAVCCRAVGQIGSELVESLRKKYGVDNVIASDVKVPPNGYPTGPFVYLDVENYHSICKLVFDYRIEWVVHLASLLSATGEKNPQFAMRLNTRGIEHVLEAARIYGLRVFAPSTIAVFGYASADRLIDWQIGRACRAALS
jgi:threonine 3-dehydrogenase